MWREGGQEWERALVWEEWVEERGKWRVWREVRGERVWKREESERDSEMRERSRWRRCVHFERAARLLMLRKGEGGWLAEERRVGGNDWEGGGLRE